MHKNKTGRNGFTIIEVMIVLAIAGLIMLIVFLAVPALQRSARNTQRKSEASQVAGVVADYISNNEGTLPNSQTTLNEAVANAKLSFYSSSNVYYGGTGTIPTTATIGGNGSASTLTTEDIIFFPGAVCNGTTATTTNASSRSYALIYAVEGASVATPQCIGS